MGTSAPNMLVKQIAPSDWRSTTQPTRRQSAGYLATVSETATITALFWRECVALAVSVPFAVAG